MIKTLDLLSLLGNKIEQQRYERTLLQIEKDPFLWLKKTILAVIKIFKQFKYLMNAFFFK
jgi:hypothetical protein